MSTVGISGAGIAIPTCRLATRAIHAVWENTPWSVVRRLGVEERAVPEPDEDTITLALEAGQLALSAAGRPAVDAVFLGTQTGPYLTRSSAAIVADALGLGTNLFASDMQFSGKSGTAALIAAAAWVKSGFGRCALAIGADTLCQHVASGDPLEYTASAGAAAFVVDGQARIATIDAIASASSDTPDGYRLDGERFIRNAGSVMTATDVGLGMHVLQAWQSLLSACGASAAEVSYLACQQPDAITPRQIAKRLGLTDEHVSRSVLAHRVGDAGAASALMALARTLEFAEAGKRVALISYGVGAGSDALLLTSRGLCPKLGVDAALDAGRSIDYSTAARYERRYQQHERAHGGFE